MRTIILLVIVLFGLKAKAQLYDAQWALDNSELDFRIADTVSLRTTAVLESFTLTNACICDTAGNLLYYTNGISICSTTDVLLNGSGLSPCPYTDAFATDGLNIHQATLFLPKPNSYQYYYLLHFSYDSLDDSRPGTIYYSLIDKDGNNGKGEVVEKNIPILTGKNLRGGGMTACRHANGRDYWIIMGASVAGSFYKFLLTPDTILGPFVQNIGPDFPFPYDLAYSKFSQDGSKYATGIFGGAPILVMDFDRCSGEFSNPITINEIAGAFLNQDTILGCQSLEFSPSGQFLYVSNPYNLDQFDLWSNNIQDSSSIYRGDTADFYGIDMLQLAPNGKLYGSTWNGGLKAIHVVNNPDLKGDSCKFVYGGQPTTTVYSLNLPNLINYRLGPLTGSGCDTLNTAISDIKARNLLRVQPNPADKYMYVEMGAQGNYLLQLYNENGQLIDTKQTRQVDIFDTEHLATGVYILSVTAKGGNQIGSKKVIVAH